VIDNAQQWLNENYSDKKQRKNIQELDLCNLNLIGELDLIDFYNLKKISIAGNPQLRSIKNEPDAVITVYTNIQEYLDKNCSNKN